MKSSIYAAFSEREDTNLSYLLSAQEAKDHTQAIRACFADFTKIGCDEQMAGQSKDRGPTPPTFLWSLPTTGGMSARLRR